MSDAIDYDDEKKQFSPIREKIKHELLNNLEVKLTKYLDGDSNICLKVKLCYLDELIAEDSCVIACMQNKW